ncbi:MAG: hypothetical protein SGCHY_005091 [Lobulomycetales sp.]
MLNERYTPLQLHNQTMIQTPGRAILRYNYGEYAKARQLFKESLDVDPNQPDTLFNLGTCLLFEKNFQSAVQRYKQTLALDPHHTDAMINIGNLMASHLGQKEQAIEYLRKATSLSDDCEARFNLAAILESTGRLPEALEQYQLALKGGVARAEENIRAVELKLQKGSDN